MALPQIIIDGRTTDDPELRFTGAGKAVCSVTVVASERRKNEHTDEWEDGDRSPFMRVTLWDRQAEELAESIIKGERVLVTGKLLQREYEKRDGGTGYSIEVKHATVAAIPGGRPKGQRSQGGNGYQHGGQQQRQQPANDPWATPAPSNDPWATGPTSQDPPF